MKRKWGKEEEEDCKIEENEEEEEEECFLQVSFSTSPLKSLFSPSSPSGEKTMFALRIYIKWGGLKLEEGISYPGREGATYVATLRFPPFSTAREKKCENRIFPFFLPKKGKSGSDNCVFFSPLSLSRLNSFPSAYRQLDERRREGVNFYLFHSPGFVGFLCAGESLSRVKKEIEKNLFYFKEKKGLRRKEGQLKAK